MTDLRLVERADIDRESDPLIDDVFAHLVKHSTGEAEFLTRSFSQREAGVQAVERGMRQARESKLFGKSRWMIGGVLAAVAATSSFWFFSDAISGGDSRNELNQEYAGSVAKQSGSVMVRVANGEWNRLSEDLELDAGSSLRTGASSTATIQTPWGASLAVGASSFVNFPLNASIAPNARKTDLNHVVNLLSGTMELDVPPLAADETFAVSAAGHQVIVHGTQFSVTVVEEAAAPCVIVRRGVVEVRGPTGNAWVKAGQRSGCGLAQEDVEAASAVVVAEEKGAKISQSEPNKENQATNSATRVVPKAPVSGAEAPSALAEQNRIFQSALSLQRDGDLKGARHELAKLLKEHPDSPLAGQARAQLVQLSSAGK